MKTGDLVKVEGMMVNSYTYAIPFLGIYVRQIPWNHPDYSPSFPTCEIITRTGVKRIGLERIKPV